MTENTATPQVSFARPTVRMAIVTLGCVIILASGCSVQKRPKVAWSTAILLRPTVPQANAQPASLNAEDAPDLEIPLVPPGFSTARSAPPRPRVPSSASIGAESNRTEAPLLVAPQITPQEAANAQQRANQSIQEAEKNLEKTRSRTLNATQADVASKVRGFLGDAREAARVGDWERAQNLARKAQVLSEELVDLL
jgi:hypothetical protein